MLFHSVYDLQSCAGAKIQAGSALAGLNFYFQIKLYLGLTPITIEILKRPYRVHWNYPRFA